MTQVAKQNKARKQLSKDKQSGKAHLASGDDADPSAPYAAAMSEPHGSHTVPLDNDVRFSIVALCHESMTSDGAYAL